MWPVNVQTFLAQDPVVANLTQVWNAWLDEAAIETFSKAGYYSQKLEIKS